MPRRGKRSPSKRKSKIELSPAQVQDVPGIDEDEEIGNSNDEELQSIEKEVSEREIAEYLVSNSNNNITEDQIEEETFSGGLTDESNECKFVVTAKLDDDDNEDEDNKEIHDTTPIFNEVFGEQKHFDSWAEFTALFDQYQIKSGSAFKVRQTVRVSYANETRVLDTIPDRFVYGRGNLVCIHYGKPYQRRSGPEDSGRKLKKKLIGRDCQAMLAFGYKKGRLHIVRHNMVHSNHELHPGSNNFKSRLSRSMVFTRDVDDDIVREVINVNPYEHGEKAWKTVIENLKEVNPKLEAATPGMVKSRLNLLLGRYEANFKDKIPDPDDELHNTLQKISHYKELAMLKPKVSSALKSLRGRKRKIPARLRDTMNSLDPNNYKSEEEDSGDDLDFEPDSSVVFGTSPKSSSKTPKKKQKILSSPRRRPHSSLSVGGSDIATLINFMEEKEEQDRQFRLEEIRIRRQEVAYQRQELNIHRQQLDLMQDRFTSQINSMRVKIEKQLAGLRQLVEAQTEMLHSQNELVKVGHLIENASKNQQFMIEVVDENGAIVKNPDSMSAINGEKVGDTDSILTVPVS